jgi:hypothetical protein
MKEDDFGAWLSIGLLGAILLIAVFMFHGCASVPPSLAITEKQVDAKIEALLKTTPSDPNGIRYNEADDTYIVKAPLMKKAVNDGIRVAEYEDEVIPAMEKWLIEHPPATFRDKARWAGWGVILTLIVEIAIYFAAGGFSQ